MPVNEANRSLCFPAFSNFAFQSQGLLFFTTLKTRGEKSPQKKVFLNRVSNDRVLPKFQQYFTHNMATAHIIHVFQDMPTPTPRIEAATCRSQVRSATFELSGRAVTSVGYLNHLCRWLTVAEIIRQGPKLGCYCHQISK